MLYNQLIVIKTFIFQVEEDCFSRRLIPPSLPPAPPDISEQELRRRYIVDDIVRSENSYLATLHRLVNVSYLIESCIYII